MFAAIPRHRILDRPDVLPVRVEDGAVSQARDAIDAQLTEKVALRQEGQTAEILRVERDRALRLRAAVPDAQLIDERLRPDTRVLGREHVLGAGVGQPVAGPRRRRPDSSNACPRSGGRRHRSCTSLPAGRIARDGDRPCRGNSRRWSDGSRRRQSAWFRQRFPRTIEFPCPGTGQSDR